MLLALITFSFVTSITPGPNNILLLASGMRFGVRRTLPHIAGIQFGVALQLALCGLGFGMLLLQVPGVEPGLKVLGTLYLLHLAWKLHRSGLRAEPSADVQPFTFWQAAAFQCINPKAWMMAITAGALLKPELSGAGYLPANLPLEGWPATALSVAALCIVFSLVGTPSSGSWAVGGALIQRVLADARREQWIGHTMVLLTLATAVMIWAF